MFWPYKHHIILFQHAYCQHGNKVVMRSSTSSVACPLWCQRGKQHTKPLPHASTASIVLGANTAMHSKGSQVQSQKDNNLSTISVPTCSHQVMPRSMYAAGYGRQQPFHRPGCIHVQRHTIPHHGPGKRLKNPGYTAAARSHDLLTFNMHTKNTL